MQLNSSLLIDDFTQTGVSSFGTPWRMFTDRVMGGLSTASFQYDSIDGRRCLRLQGNVSLANNGGFVQVALPLEKNGRAFNADQFTGVRLWAWGNGEPYHVHIRTHQSRAPWQYFSAEFPTSKEWTKVEIPFEQFKPQGLREPLDTSRLERIAIVAIEKEFQADVAVSRLEFY